MEHLLLLKTIIAFGVILGVLVLVHEWGHFTAARLSKMNAPEFSIGFGPLIARVFRRNGTDYNIRAVPLGGFVRIAGMDPTEEEVSEGGFYSRPIWQRAMVIIAGPFMSLLLGYIVFLLIGFVWGFPNGNVSTQIGQVAQKSVAEKAGLKTGDIITAVDGKPVKDGRALVDIIHTSAGKKLTFTVSRGGQQTTVTAAPKLTKNDQWPKATPQQRKEYNLHEYEGRLGFVPVPETERTGFVRSIELGTLQTVGMIVGIVKTLFSREIGKNVGGIVLIGYQTQEMVRLGWQWIFNELAALSIMLGIINLVPWPVLDGSHLLYLMIEKIRGKRLEPEWLLRIQAAGMAVLMFLVVFLVYFDIVRIATHTIPQ